MKNKLQGIFILIVLLVFFVGCGIIGVGLERESFSVGILGIALVIIGFISAIYVSDPN